MVKELTAVRCIFATRRTQVNVTKSCARPLAGLESRLQPVARSTKPVCETSANTSLAEAEAPNPTALLRVSDAEAELQGDRRACGGKTEFANFRL
jgi:hypothetical protein